MARCEDVVDFDSLIAANKRILSEEYNVSVELPDDEFFAAVERIGDDKIERRKKQGMSTQVKPNVKQEFADLIATLG